MTIRASRQTGQPSPGKHRDLSGVLVRIATTDLLVIVWAVVGAKIIRFGSGAMISEDPGDVAFTVMLIVVWMLMLRVHRAYDRRFLGHGPDEYKVVAKASFQLFAVLAIFSYLLRLDIARGFVAIAMPAGMVGLLVTRWIWRKWLTLHRIQGLLSASVLVVGDREHLMNLIRSLDSVPDAGYHVVAACCGDAGDTYLGRVPVLGDETEAAAIAPATGGGRAPASGLGPRGP